MQVKKQQLELDMEQQTGSKSGKAYIKAVCCPPTCLTYMQSERLLLNHAKTWGFLAPGGEEFNLGPETRLDPSELLCNKVLLKYKGDRESL